MQPVPISMICLLVLFIAHMTAGTPGNSSSILADSSPTAFVDSAGLLSAFPEPNSNCAVDRWGTNFPDGHLHQPHSVLHGWLPP